MALLLYALGFAVISSVWLIAIAGVWTLAENAFEGRSVGRSLAILFAVLMSVVTFLALATLNREACSAQLDLEICDE